MDTNNRERDLNTGEARIKRALHLSSVLLIMLALAVGFVFWIFRQPLETEVIPDVEVRVPEPQQSVSQGEPPQATFSDITNAAGIDFVHVNGADGQRLMPETIGSGVAFIDYDNDGDQDLVFINSRYWASHEAKDEPSQRFYRNDGAGRFVDVTAAAGLDLSLYGMGVAVGDYDNDGWQDLFISSLNKNLLLRNQQGTFLDVSEQTGVAGRATDWSTGAAFIDYDNDGDLDLFVANYVKWSREIDLEIDFKLTGLGRAYGAPNHFVGTNNLLYRNDGNGRFTDVSASAGIQVTDPVSGAPVGKALGIAPVDYDGDGWIDLFIANDTVRNFLFRNLGNGRFEEIGTFEGIAYDREGKATSAMGIDSAWYRNDKELGLAIGNFANEMSSLLVTTEGRSPFADEAILEGFGPASRLALTFGVLFFDYDLDGRQDLFQANGHLEHEINKVQPSQQYAQPAQLFWNCGDSCRDRFQLVTNPGAIDQPLVGRAAAYADIDLDGDLDLVVTQNGRRAVLLRNDQTLAHHWLRLRLIGKHSNRDAIGSRIELTAGGITQKRLVMPTRSYLSQVELPVTFGLGKAERVDHLSITWPDGSQQLVPVEQVDTSMIIEQAAPET